MASSETLPAGPITGALLARLPIAGRSELVEGRVVPMSPTGRRHAKIELLLGRVLDEHVRERAAGEIYVGEVGIYTRRHPDTVRGADVAFLSNERIGRLDPEAPFLTVAPEVVAEILSPNDRAEEIERKTREYLAVGVVEVWIVDPENRLLQRRRGGSETAEILGEDQTLATPVLPGFELPLDRLFAD